MRDLIKILIAFAFMVVAFFVGKYFADEKCAIQLKEVNEKITADKNHIELLKDSLTILKTEISKQGSIKHFDTLKTKTPETKKPTHKKTHS